MSFTNNQPTPPAVPPQAQVLANAAVSAANAVLAAPPGSEPSWAKPAVAIFSMVLLAGVIAYAIVSKDHDTMMLCVGAIISMATGAGNYYLGSSAGSDKKTELLSKAQG